MESNDTNADDLAVFSEIVSALTRLEPERRESVLGAVMTFLRMEGRAKSATPIFGEATVTPVSGGYTEDRSLSPKEFLLEKQPRTDVERVACLAYYLAHYRDMPHFKTIDLSTLNTEAAQMKFSNPTLASNNASKMGYLVPATKGQRQLSAFGEKYVRALPDRNAAKQVMDLSRPRRKNRKSGSKQLDQE